MGIYPQNFQNRQKIKPAEGMVVSDIFPDDKSKNGAKQIADHFQPNPRSFAKKRDGKKRKRNSQEKSGVFLIIKTI